jgi:tRNA-dihydrouridine synthase
MPLEGGRQADHGAWVAERDDGGIHVFGNGDVHEVPHAAAQRFEATGVAQGIQGLGVYAQPQRIAGAEDAAGTPEDALGACEGGGRGHDAKYVITCA